jgi:diaphanous 1
VTPPDALLTQINVYTEEKYEDEEDLRDRARSLVKEHARTGSDSEFALLELIGIAKQHEEVYPIMVETLKRYAVILEKDIMPCVFVIVLRVSH